YIIFGWHPLDGRREAEITTLDQAAERRLYGVDPLFMFDPVNTANGPVAGLHGWIVARWRTMPAALRDLFTRSFTAGLANPDAGRVVETEWRQVFARLRDAVARCCGCGFEVPVDVETARVMPTCMACGKIVPRPTRITIGNYLVATLPGHELYRHHIELGASIILAEPVGRIEQHPTNTEILGLHNLSAEAWTGQLRDGNVLPVAPGKTVRIVDGLGVDFGHRRGTVSQGDQLAGDAT
ncbi:MAG TPA: hypothetical protein VG271_01755, partial [Beijerinckiaceae bacterium]|nr:hypothetical protein [Beijerinckiaceae bacterium]